MRLNNKQKNKKWLLIVIPFILVLIALSVFLIIHTIKGSKVDHIGVSRLPYKTEYIVGEEFNPEGILIQVTKRNDKFFFVDSSELSYEGFDSSKTAERLRVKVIYKEFSTYITVSIKEPAKPKPYLTSIELRNFTKRTYTLEEWETEGLMITGAYLICKYSDDSQISVGLAYKHIYGTSKITGIGEYELTIKYNDNGIVLETPLIITIN